MRARLGLLSCALVAVLTISSGQQGHDVRPNPQREVATATTFQLTASTSVNARCSDVLVLGARGSGEKEFDDRRHPWFGSRSGAFLSALQKSLGSRRTVSERGLNISQYPAYSVWKLFHGFTASGAYFRGLSAGVTNVKATLRAQTAAC